MSKDLPVFLWTEVNDWEGETWHMGIIPKTKADSDLFSSLKDKFYKLNKKFDYDTFSFDLFNGNIAELDNLIKNGEGSYMPEWNSLKLGFTFKFKLLDFILSELLKSDKKLDLSELKNSISSFSSDSENETKITNDLISSINFYFGKKKYTKDIEMLYDLLISELAYKMQIFD